MADDNQHPASLHNSEHFGAQELLPLVYQELRRLAAAQLVNEPSGHTLDATALVHEAYLRLGNERSFTSKSHYLRAAAISMRRILVDHARAKHANKRGGEWDRHNLVDAVLPGEDADLLALDEALTAFAAIDPQADELVQLRYFAGL